MSHLGAPLACVLRLLNVADEEEEVEEEEEELEEEEEEEDWRDELVVCPTELSLFLQNNDKLGSTWSYTLFSTAVGSGILEHFKFDFMNLKSYTCAKRTVSDISRRLNL